MSSDDPPALNKAARVLVLVGGVTTTVSALLPWSNATDGGSFVDLMQSLAGVAGLAGIIITLIAVSRLRGYRDLNNRPTAVVALFLLAPLLVFSLALWNNGMQSAIGPGFLVAVLGVGFVLGGTSLDELSNRKHE